MTRQLTFAQALLEATEQSLETDPRVYVIGLGVTDPKGIFGTTLGLERKFGPNRVLDMPTSENGMTGVAIGSALMGLRPIIVHQRVDFVLLALDQIINNAANWRYMFNGQAHIPLVVRAIIGRGWGQGAQHGQSLQALFAHIPGLKVVMPATPADAKGLLIAAIQDPDPVIFLEHRWLHSTFGPVDEAMTPVSIGKARIMRRGRDATIVSISHMTIEALKAAEILARDGIDAEVVDLRSLKPLDRDCLADSVRRTGRLLVADAAWRSGGVAGEVMATVMESAWSSMKCAPMRVTLPDAPVPSSPALAAYYYPQTADLVNGVRALLDLPARSEAEMGIADSVPRDVPDSSFTGPF